MMLVQLRGDLACFERIRKQEFNSLEPRLARGGKTVKEGQLGKQQAEVGGEVRHGLGAKWMVTLS